MFYFNPLNAELNPICHLPALLGAHQIFHIGGLRVKPSLFCVVESEVVSVARRSRHVHTFTYNRLTSIASLGM